MSNQPNEVDKVKEDPSLHRIVRSSFRIPIEDSQNAWVKIDNKEFPIRDICLEGIGIILDKPDGFNVADVKKDCELKLYDTHIKDLNGRIVHFSLNSGKDWQCGIQWLSVNEESAQKIFNAVLKLKVELLKEHNHSGPIMEEN